MDEFDSAIEKLIEYGKSKSFITWDEINGLLPPEILNSDKMESVLSLLAKNNIQIEEEEDPLEEEDDDTVPVLDDDEEIGTEEIHFLKTCCNELIKFRRVHFGEYKNDIGELLATVRELVVKPDALEGLLLAVTEWVNTAAMKEIDFNALSKFADIIPVLNGMNNAGVAKAIIRDSKNKSNFKVVE